MGTVPPLVNSFHAACRLPAGIAHRSLPAVDLPGAAAGHPTPSVTAAERQPMSIDGIRGAAAMTSQVGASERQPPTTTVTAEVHLRRSDDSERRHGSSTTSTLDARHRRDVRTSRGRTTPTYVAEISTSRTDVRLQCTSISSRATDRPILMLAGRGSIPNVLQFEYLSHQAEVERRRLCKSANDSKLQ